VVKRGDFALILAEFWADGPNSDTPPGHWNVLANYIADDPLTVKRIGGGGKERGVYAAAWGDAHATAA